MLCQRSSEADSPPFSPFPLFAALMARKPFFISCLMKNVK